MKRCLTCAELKPLEAFYRRRDQPDGRAGRCLSCGSTKARRDNTRRAARRQVDPEYLARTRAYNRDYRRRVKTEQYGVDFERLAAVQGDRCAICRRTAAEVDIRGRTGEVLHVDHDHRCCPRGGSCGQCVRGLLCRKCNSAIALFDDDPARLTSAISYLTAGGQP